QGAEGGGASDRPRGGHAPPLRDRSRRSRRRPRVLRSLLGRRPGGISKGRGREPSFGAEPQTTQPQDEPQGEEEMSSPETSIRKSVVINAPIAHAFKVFTERFDTWWPRSHHIGKVEPYTAILEAREGGRWFERGADGSECEWGRVLVYAPPTRVAVSWHLGPDYVYDPDPSKASRGQVAF